jgi:hypothetical protein
MNVREFVDAVPWTTARSQDHQYVTRQAAKELGLERAFERLVIFIREHGYRDKFQGRSYTYFDLNDGTRLWSMGWPVPATVIINRAEKPR